MRTEYHKVRPVQLWNNILRVYYWGWTASTIRGRSIYFDSKGAIEALLYKCRIDDVTHKWRFGICRGPRGWAAWKVYLGISPLYRQCLFKYILPQCWRVLKLYPRYMYYRIKSTVRR